MAKTPADAICQFVPPFIRFLREGLAAVNISPARFQVLESLKLNGDSSMVQLADRLSVTKRNITTLVDGLEVVGWVARRPHPSDRRSTLVALTPVGEEEFGRAAAVQRKHLADLLSHLDAEQKAHVTRALSDLTKVMIDKDRAGEP